MVVLHDAVPPSFPESFPLRAQNRVPAGFPDTWPVCVACACACVCTHSGELSVWILESDTVIQALFYHYQLHDLELVA